MRFDLNEMPDIPQFVRFRQTIILCVQALFAINNTEGIQYMPIANFTRQLPILQFFKKHFISSRLGVGLEVTPNDQELLEKNILSIFSHCLSYRIIVDMNSESGRNIY